MYACLSISVNDESVNDFKRSLSANDESVNAFNLHKALTMKALAISITYKR